MRSLNAKETPQGTPDPTVNEKPGIGRRRARTIIKTLLVGAAVFFGAEVDVNDRGPAGFCPDVVPQIITITPDPGTAGGEAFVTGQFNPARGVTVEFGEVISDTAPYTDGQNTLKDPIEVPVSSAASDRITFSVPPGVARVEPPTGVRVVDCGGRGEVRLWQIVRRVFFPLVHQQTHQQSAIQ